MKINCGPTEEERFVAFMQAATRWHPFFALWPRRVGSNDCRWLEVIERKGRYITGYANDGFWTWEYRAKASA